jgi:hypothetical protein
MSNRANIEEGAMVADLVIGSVLIPREALHRWSCRG